MQEENAEGSEVGLSHLPGNGSESPSGHESPVLEIERSGSGRLAEKKAGVNSLVRTATGPRTPQGKERSKHNAFKHGILSGAVVLRGESRAAYDSLLKGLWEAIQPEGKLEEVLVEKLTTILWRHRRLLVAEAAEIRKSTEFLEWDEQNQQREEAEETGTSSMPEFEGGLIRKIQIPGVLGRCLGLLAELREGIETKGFDQERAQEILETIYGNRGGDRLWDTLYDSYFIWLHTANASEEEREREGYATPAQCKRNVLQGIDGEIRRLKRYEKARASIEADRTKLEMLRRRVPDSLALDRLLRYEASLERAFDRTLSQLERLQRMRLGQPIAPPIKIQLSG